MLARQGAGGGGVGAVDIPGWEGVVQNRESPDFRSPEIGRCEIEKPKIITTIHKFAMITFYVLVSARLSEK